MSDEQDSVEDVAEKKAASVTAHPEAGGMGSTSHLIMPMPVYASGRYTTPFAWQEPSKAMWKLMKYKLTESKKVVIPPAAELDQLLPVVKPDPEKLANPPADSVQLTWIGHASFLVQMDGVTFLTDPIFSERCSATQWFGPKRYRPTPLKMEELPKIDFIVISHSHYDHLDLDTVKYFVGKDTKVFVPEGLKKWFLATGFADEQVTELMWWGEAKFNDAVKVVSTPCQHWCRRGLFDFNVCLWCSWAIVGKTSRVWFAGDTGYCETFKHIGSYFKHHYKDDKPFTVGLIPIGAYEPNWFMKYHHVNPEEAVAIHQDIGARTSLAMHWGTFVLTDEPIMEPPQKLAAELKRLDLSPTEFVAVQHGAITHVRHDVLHTPQPPSNAGAADTSPSATPLAAGESQQ